MKALIKVGYGCNEHCTFCHALDRRPEEATAREVHAKIRRAKQLGCSMVALSGGEPTIRPELVQWAAHTATLDMDFGLITNGQMLAYPELVDRLLEHRMRYAHVALHGATDAVHRRMTRADGFSRTLQAIRDLAGRGIDVTVCAVVTRQNLDELVPIVDLLLPCEAIRIKFAMVAPKGGGATHFDAVVPRVAQAASRVREAIDHGRRRAGAGGPTFAHEGFPLCLLPGLEDRCESLRSAGFGLMVEVGEHDFFPIDDLLMIQPDATCAGCPRREPCPGLFRGYYDVYGAGEVGRHPQSSQPA